MTRPGPFLRALTLSVSVAAAAAAQTQQTPGFTEKVEVNVRTILAVVTDGKGKPIERPLSIEEVEVLEDGIPAKVLGVDDALTRRMHARSSMQEEVHLIRQSLERLGKWANLRSDRRPSVLYLASDGFDLVLSDFYRNYLEGPEGEQLKIEFALQIPSLVARTEETLAGRELMTVPLAIGGTEGFFANSPSTVGRRSESDLRNPVSDAPTFLFVRPLDPLRQIAGASGGEVVTREDSFPMTLDRLSHAVAITYRMDRPPNGRVHKLEVKTSRRGVTLRAAQSVLDAPELAASAQSAVQALESVPAQGSLPVEALVDLLEVKPDKRLVGDVQVSVDLGSIVETLEKVGPGRMRVTLAIRATGMQPFVHHEEVDLSREGEGAFWTYAFPLEWPPEATRVAVTVVELKTGEHGTAAADLPKPE